MKIISTNIAQKKTITWRGKQEQTGIYKYPVNEAIFLGAQDVKGDDVVDRKYHGGIDRACYLYAQDHYSYWKEKHPNLDWDYGMFGENITVQGFDEHSVLIGNTYEVGEAIVQISTPRQPCYKLGIRFGNQRIVKQFAESLLTGVYVRILKQGTVKIGQEFVLTKENVEGITIADINSLMFYFDKDKHQDILRKALSDPLILEEDKKRFRKHL